MPAPSGPKTEAAPLDMQDIGLAILDLAKSIREGQNTQANPQIDALLKVIQNQEDARPHENVFNPPMHSHYNPQGDRDNPRAELKCQVGWCGFKLSKECLTSTEINLVNRLEAGEYRVTKADGKQIPFVVTSKFSDSGKMEKMSITYACKSTEDRSNHLSMESYMRQVLGEDVSSDTLRAQIEALKQQLAVK